MLLDGPVRLNILALETSGVYCSAALWRDGLLSLRHEEAPRQHGERLLPMLDEVLTEGNLSLQALDAVAFGRGPGSFTGVRIAAAVAQGVAFGSGVGVIGISTLAGLAHASWRAHPDWFGDQSAPAKVLAAIDARIGEVYWGLYRVSADGRVEPLGRESVGAPDSVSRTNDPHSTNDDCPIIGVGNAWSLYADGLTDTTGIPLDRTDANLVCSAQDIAALAALSAAQGQILPPEQGVPIYVRDRVAAKPAALSRAQPPLKGG